MGLAGYLQARNNKLNIGQEKEQQQSDGHEFTDGTLTLK